MLSSTLKTSVSRSNFHKTSKFSYSVWRSVKNEHAFDSSTKLACQNGVQKVLINFQCSPYIKNCSVNSRLVSTSVTRYKEPSSKVEETVERLKEKKKGDSDTLETKILSESKEVDHAKKKSVWVSVKNVLKHYYSGFRLLFLDVKVSSKIVYKITRGKPLTRRESRQLVRTTSVGQIYYYCFYVFTSMIIFFAIGSFSVSAIFNIYHHPIYGICPSSCIKTFSWDASINIYFNVRARRKIEKIFTSENRIHKVSAKNFG